MENCPVCGKQFRVTGFGWGYAYGKKYVCSYSCMRKAGEAVRDRRKANGRKSTLTDEQKARVGELLAAGENVLLVTVARAFQIPQTSPDGVMV